MEKILSINIIISDTLASYKDKNNHKHKIVGIGLDKGCPNNFTVVSTIECKNQIWFELQNHFFMFGDLDEKRLKEIVKILSKIDIMINHAKKGDDFEHLYFDTFSNLNTFNRKKVRLEIEHDDKHDVLDFRQIYYFISNKVNSYDY